MEHALSEYNRVYDDDIDVKNPEFPIEKLEKKLLKMFDSYGCCISRDKRRVRNMLKDLVICRFKRLIKTKNFNEIYEEVLDMIDLKEFITYQIEDLLSIMLKTPQEYDLAINSIMEIDPNECWPQSLILLLRKLCFERTWLLHDIMSNKIAPEYRHYTPKNKKD